MGKCEIISLVRTSQQENFYMAGKKAKHFLSYFEAQEYLHKHAPQVRSRAQYIRWHKHNDKRFLPSRPHRVYDNFSWNDFLGTNNSFERTRLARKGMKRTYRDYWPAVRWAQQQAKLFQLSTREQWMQFYEEHDIPDDIPKRPWQEYDDFSIDVWLGKNVKGHLETAKNAKRIVALHHCAGMPANCIIVKVWADGMIGEDDSGMLGRVYRAFVLEDENVMRVLDGKIRQHGHQRDSHWVVPNINALLWDLIDLPIAKVT